MAQGKLLWEGDISYGLRLVARAIAVGNARLRRARFISSSIMNRMLPTLAVVRPLL